MEQMKSIRYGNYIVYEDGKCYSKYSNKFLKPSKQRGGYLIYTLYEDGEKERIYVHRLVGKLFLEKPDNWEELTINHKDGNKENNHVSNLEWATSYENNLHARVNGLNNISQSNSDRWKNEEWAKKTAKKISENCNNAHTYNPRFRYYITDEFGENITRIQLAEILGFSQSHTDGIIRKAAQDGDYHPSLIKHKITVIDTKE